MGIVPFSKYIVLEISIITIGVVIVVVIKYSTPMCKTITTNHNYQNNKHARPYCSIVTVPYYIIYLFLFTYIY